MVNKQQTDFQLQHPLSPRKFWKKIISSLFIFLVGTVFFSNILFFTLAFLIPANYPQTSGGVILTLISIAGITYVLVLIIYAYYVKAYIRLYYYDFGNQFVTIQKGVFTPREIHIPYQKIQDVYVDQDLLDRLLNIYDVHIASATISSGIEAHIDGVDQAVAEKLKELLLSKINGGNLESGNFSNPSSPLSIQGPNSSVVLRGEISTQTYPIANNWFGLAMIGAISFSIITTVFALGIIGYIGTALNQTIRNEIDPLIIISSIWQRYWLLLMVMIIVVYVIRIIWLYCWQKRYFFRFTNDYIQLKTGVIIWQEKHVPYRAIQNVNLSQGLIERFFGLATVTIENAAAAQSGRNSGFSTSTIDIVGQPYQRAVEITAKLNEVVSSFGSQSKATGL